MAKDPVCGMEIEEKSAAHQHAHNGVTYYFCSDDCHETFMAEPAKYAIEGELTTEHEHHEHHAPATAEAHDSHVHAAHNKTAHTGFREDAELLQLELPVVGIHCPSCTVTIEKAVKQLDGVNRANCNAATEKLNVTYNPKELSVQEVSKAVKSAGYSVGSSRMRIGIEGMNCASCVEKIEKALLKTPGVLSASVDLGSKEAQVDYLPEKTGKAAIHKAISSTGYKASSPNSEEPVDKEAEARDREYRSLTRKWIFAAIIAAPVMIIGFPQVFTFLQAISEHTWRIIWMIVGVLMLPVLFYSGGHFFSGAVSAFKHRSADMNTLIALGTSAAWLYSGVALLLPQIFPEGTAEPFYDVVGVVIALVVLGQALPAEQHQQAQRRPIPGRRPMTCTWWRSGARSIRSC